MKKYTKQFIAVFSTLSIVLSGCSLSKDESIPATEYVSEEQDAAATSTTAEEAATENSIVVVNDLFEPVLEELASSEASAADSAAEASTQSDAEEADKVEIVFFGDSQIANGRDEGTDIPSLLSAKVPNSVIYNLAIGGTTASVEKSTSNYSPENLTSTCFLGMTYCLAGKSDREATLSSYPNVLSTMNAIDPAKVDMYIIEYGTNDFINTVPLDSTSDPQIGAHALYNALAMGIEEIKAMSPDAEIIVMTPFYGIYVDGTGAYIGDSYIVSNGVGTLADYAKKVTNVAEDYHLYSFDDMFMTKCDLYLDTAGEYLKDNLHLSLKGRQVFTRLLSHLVNFILGNEPYAYLEQDFINIADFDPDEVYRYDEGLMELYYPDSWERYIKGEFPLAQPSDEAVERYKNEKGEG